MSDRTPPKSISIAKREGTIDLAVAHRQGHAKHPFVLDINTSFPAKGITAIFGPSGCGKTTLLRCIAGLEKESNTTLRFHNKAWDSDKRSLPTYKRNIGYVFQSNQLFPHLNVIQNLRYAIKRSKRSHKRTSEYPGIDELISLFSISSLLDRKVQSLSGGESQRVAICRALASHPELLLLDEPLAALDDARKLEILPYLEKLNEELALPILYVSHSTREISRLADHLLIMEAGKVVRAGNASALLNDNILLALDSDPAATIIDAVVTQRDPQWQLIGATFGGGKLWLNDNGERIGAKVRLRIQSRDVSIMTTEPENTSIQNRIKVQIAAIQAAEHPAQRLITLAAGDTILRAHITQRAVESLKIQAGLTVWATIKAAAIIR